MSSAASSSLRRPASGRPSAAAAAIEFALLAAMLAGGACLTADLCGPEAALPVFTGGNPGAATPLELVAPPRTAGAKLSDYRPPLHLTGCPDCISPLSRWILAWQTPGLIVALAAATGVWAVLRHERVSRAPLAVRRSAPRPPAQAVAGDGGRTA